MIVVNIICAIIMIVCIGENIKTIERGNEAGGAIALAICAIALILNVIPIMEYFNG